MRVDRLKAHVLLSAAYFLSGMCALIYETVWIYKFSRIFGSTVFAMSFVVATFFAGLALGSQFIGHKSSRAKNPLRLYAILELAIGCYALAFPLLIAGAEKVYASAYPSIAGSFALLTLVRMLLSLAVLLPPTILMGGTLPVLLTYFADHMATLGNRAGLVYGMNALGAAAGSLLCGYALMEALGVAWTNALAGIINLAIGGVAWGLSMRVGRAAPTSEGPAADGAKESGAAGEKSPAVVAIVVLCFAISGFVSMSYEVIWLRYLTFYFHETIQLYTGIIAAFVLGIGIGSVVCGMLIAKVKHPVALLGVLQTGIGLLTMLALYLPLHWFQAIYAAGVASAFNVLLILMALLMLPAALMGATFPVVATIIVRNLREVGSRVGGAYALNTLGGILGLLAAGFVLQRLLGMQVSLYVLFGTNMLLATILLGADKEFARPKLGAVPLALSVAAIVIIQACGLRLPDAVLRKPMQPNEQVLEMREGLVGITWATKAKGGSEVHLWENGCRIGRGGRSTFLAQGYIPMLIAPQLPRDVLGLAFGAGLSYRAARLFPEVQHLDFVDISRDNMLVALRNFPENAGLKDDPRARFIVDDAYSYAKYNRNKYGLILMEPTPPRFCYQTASLYTKEFYELARQRLTQGGLFTQVLSLRDFSPGETASVMRTFASVFPHRLLWRNGWDCLMIGSGEEFHLDLPTISERLNRPEVQKTLRASAPTMDKYYILDNLISGLLLADDDFRRAAAGGTIYTDDNCGLRFASGRNTTTENIRAIHAHLTSWLNIGRLFDRFPDFDKKQPVLAMKRQYFMAMMYKHVPREFDEVFRAYIKEYSLRKEEDLNDLCLYLLYRGMKDKAEEVEDIIDSLDDERHGR